MLLGVWRQKKRPESGGPSFIWFPRTRNAEWPAQNLSAARSRCRAEGGPQRRDAGSVACGTQLAPGLGFELHGSTDRRVLKSKHSRPFILAGFASTASSNRGWETIFSFTAADSQPQIRSLGTEGAAFSPWVVESKLCQKLCVDFPRRGCGCL